jgi:hypothetical protein
MLLELVGMSSHRLDSPFLRSQRADPQRADARQPAPLPAQHLAPDRPHPVAQKTGIPLATIQKTLASLPKERTPTVDDWRKLSTRWRAELDGRIQRLIRLRDRLNDCIGCECLSVTTCPLRNPEDALGRKGSGPRLLEQE